MHSKFHTKPPGPTVTANQHGRQHRFLPIPYVFRAVTSLLFISGLLGASACDVASTAGNIPATQTAIQATIAALPDISATLTALVPPTLEPTHILPTNTPMATTTPHNTSTPVPTEPANSRVLNGVRVTINKVRYAVGRDVLEPDPTLDFLVIDVSFENTSSDTKDLSPLNYYMRDSTGKQYIDFGAVRKDQSPIGTLYPGDKIRGEAVFMVPKGSTGLIFYYEEMFAPGQLRFSIGN